MDYRVFIGAEVHIELKTKTKVFCSCPADYFGNKPNILCCPVCLGLPGALPVANIQAVKDTLEIGLVLNCHINQKSFFDRKNYFYPDLPKGYQISQHYQPFCQKGDITIGNKKIRIREVHLEEDTGKLIHLLNQTLIDFNRSGVALAEIVSEPDMVSSGELKDYLKKIQQIVRYIGVSDCDMEKGSMRCEPSISIGPKGQKTLPDYRVEIKNINSFKFAQKAVDYEIDRQRKIILSGGKIIQETRGWSESKNCTFSQRTKEDAKDYRYFPEPDIPPLKFSKEDIEKIRKILPELPDSRKKRIIQKYSLTEYLAEILTEQKFRADYFEETIKSLKKSQKSLFTKVANLIVNKKIDISQIKPEQLAKSISGQKQLSGINQTDLKKIIDRVITANQKAVGDYKAGKSQTLMYLVGCVMKETKGKGQAKEIIVLLKNRLKD